MKTTMKLLLMLLVVTGAITLTSCKKLPDQVTISGIVTNDGQPMEDVRVCVTSVAPYSGFGFIGAWYTDERGRYEVEFEPYKSSIPYTIHFDITQDDGDYSYSCEVDVYQAVHEINAVLSKKEK